MIPKKHSHFGKVLAMISLIAVVVGVGLYTGTDEEDKITGAAVAPVRTADLHRSICAPNCASATIIDANSIRIDGSRTATRKIEGGRQFWEVTTSGEFGAAIHYYDIQGREIRGDGTLVDSVPITRTVFDTLDILTTPTGLGYFSKYFFKQETLDTWKETVDRQFATYYLGTEYWESEICSLYADRTAQGVAYFTNKIGVSGIAAHVEATRAGPQSIPDFIDTGYDDAEGDEEHGVITPNTFYLYKLTFNVRNGVSANDPSALSLMKFNVYLRGDREVTLYEEDIELKKGEEFGAGGSSAIVQYSKSNYEMICIRFDRVPLQWTLQKNELCNEIAQLDPTPTYINSPTTSTTTTPTTTDDGNPVNQI